MIFTMMQPPPALNFYREPSPNFHPCYGSLPSQHRDIGGFSRPAHVAEPARAAARGLPAAPAITPRPSSTKEGSSTGQMVPASPIVTMDHTASKAGVCWGTHHAQDGCCSLLSHASLRLATSQCSLCSLVSIALGITSSHLPNAPSEQTFC